MTQPVRSMDAAQANHSRKNDYIQKSNLWKFFKVLRVQANPVYCMLVASPVDCAWITVIDKQDTSDKKRISLQYFVDSLKKMPSIGKRYRIGFKVLSESDTMWRENVYEAEYRNNLSVEIILGLFPAIVAYHCMKAIKRGEVFELTPDVIKYYKFKKRYLDQVQKIVKSCNEIIQINM